MIVMTKKAARETGYLRAVDLESGDLIPRRDAEPLTVKGQSYFHREQCERLISEDTAQEMGLIVPENVPPARVASYPRGRSWIKVAVFRVSDCRPFVAVKKARPENPPKLITELEALAIISISIAGYQRADARRERLGITLSPGLARHRAAQLQRLLTLRDYAIASGFKDGRLAFIGVNAGQALYDSQSRPHGRYACGLIPVDAEVSATHENEWASHWLDQTRLKDAVFTLERLSPDVLDGFVYLELVAV